MEKSSQIGPYAMKIDNFCLMHIVDICTFLSVLLSGKDFIKSFRIKVHLLSATSSSNIFEDDVALNAKLIRNLV